MATRYYFETRTSNAPRSFVAENDQTALEHLKKVEPKAVLLYVEERRDEMRTIWEKS